MEGNSSNGTVNLNEVNRVLVKIFFTNEKLIPPGIPRKERPSHQQMDQQHAHEALSAGEPELTELGRIRENRVTTGEQVIHNLPDVQVAMLRRGLTNNRFSLRDVHYFLQPPQRTEDRPKKWLWKWVVCVTFSRLEENQTVPDLDRPTLEAMRALAKMTWGYCHSWKNRLDGLATVELLKRQWDDRQQQYLLPRYAVVTRQGQLRAIAVTQPVTEEEE